MSETLPGLQCPDCGCPYSRVIRTRGIVDGVARRRRCKGCSQPYLTHELKAGESSALDGSVERSRKPGIA